MIGKLQSNKAKDAVKLFDYIHSVDNQKLADALAKHQLNLNRDIKYFIQVNIGNEIQKSGIPVGELDAFYNYCSKEINLKIVGLMVIPPIDESVDKYKSTNELNKSLALENLSMGMCRLYRSCKKWINFCRIRLYFWFSILTKVLNLRSLMTLRDVFFLTIHLLFFIILASNMNKIALPLFLIIGFIL